MKKYLFLFLIPFVFACGPSKKEVELQAKLDSIEAQSSAKEEAINDFMTTINAVEENLAQIKEKESIISLTATEGGADAKTRISDDINTIYSLMKENQDKVALLEKKLRNSRYKGAQLTKTIAKLKKRVEEQALQITTMKKELAQKNIVIEGLNEDLQELSSNVENLSKQTKEQEEEISKKTTELNTAYYVVGKKSELKENKVIDRDGGFLGLGKTSKLSKDLNTDYFTKIDITKISSIPVGSDNAELISSHPAGTYKFEGEKPIKNLIITDAEKFWSASKYLIIQVK